MSRPRLPYLTLTRRDPRTGGGRHAYANLRALLASERVDVAYVGPAMEAR